MPEVARAGVVTSVGGAHAERGRPLAGPRGADIALRARVAVVAGVPFGAAGFEQMPVAGSQVPAT